ncbi:MAG: glycosyltransferase family 39 protein [Ruthenibacterium sp.]
MLFAALAVYTFTIGLIFVLNGCGTPSADQSTVVRTASEFIAGNYREFTWNHYLFFNPHQLGLVALLEVLFRLFGDGNYLALRVLNILCVIAIYYFLYRIILRLSGGNSLAGNAVLVTLFFCPYTLLYCSLVYNDLIGLALGLLAIWLLMEYLSTQKKAQFIGSILAISVSFVLRNNSAIILIAMVIILVFHLFRTKRYSRLVLPVLMIACVLLCNTALKQYYSNRSGEKVNVGIPAYARLVMGFQDSATGPGWYNNYVWAVYEANYFNTNQTLENCRNDLIKIVADFKKNPARTVDFFYKKYVSQWCDPTLDTFSTTWANISEQPTPLYSSIYGGKLYYPIYMEMVFFQFAIVAGTLFFVLSTWHNPSWTLNKLLPAIIIIGGFLFHMIFEAKGRYVFPYFMMEIPYAIIGYLRFMDSIHKKIAQIRESAVRKKA